MPDTDVLLADGSTARIREIRPDDGAALVALHSRLSSESIALRFFGPHPRLSDREVEHFTHCDGVARAALVAFRGGDLVAVVRYDRSTGSEEAEVAFVVDDALQGKGIATILLEHLAALARRQGIRRFVADTLSENHRMLGVLRDAGYSRQYRRDAEVVRVVLDISPSQEAVDAIAERDRQAVVRSVARLLRPRSVAVIGAAREPGTIGHQLLSNLLGSGFVGPVYPVNPSASYVASIPCWPDVAAIPGEVDLALLAVPAGAVLQVVEQCGRKGVGALVIITAGFAEAGEDGTKLQAEVTRMAHSYGMRIVGPNCFGVINTEPAVSMNATFAPTPPVAGGIGFVSQSGGLGIALLREVKDRGLGLSSFVSTGNKADISGNDLLLWWEQDPTTTVVLMYLESFGNPRKFRRIASRVGRTKPIVAVKSGRTSAGSRGAASHTAALTSPDEAVDALFRQTGVIRVDTIEELFDVASVLAAWPAPGGSRVAIITNAGGPGILAADACVGHGLTVPEFSAPTTAALRTILPPGAGVGNPVDMIASASAETYRRTLKLLIANDEVDSLLVVFTPPLVTRADDVASAVRDVADEVKAAGIPKTIVACFLGDPDAPSMLRSAKVTVPCFSYPETAARALAHAAHYADWLARPPSSEAAPGGTDANAARRVIESATSGRRPEDLWLTGDVAMTVLRSFGIPVATTRTVHDVKEALSAAGEVGYPVVLKAVGASIVHKTEMGAVRVALGSAEDVTDAYRSMTERLGKSMESAVVQPMVGPGAEMIVGFIRHPSFGAQVVVGLGGIAVEVLNDHSTGLAPLTSADARELVMSLRSVGLLEGYRGSEPVDIDALVDLVVRLSWLAEDVAELAEADCNPVIASSSGLVVVDARFKVKAVEVDGLGDLRHL